MTNSPMTVWLLSSQYLLTDCLSSSGARLIKGLEVPPSPFQSVYCNFANAKLRNKDEIRNLIQSSNIASWLQLAAIFMSLKSAHADNMELQPTQSPVAQLVMQRLHPVCKNVAFLTGWHSQARFNLHKKSPSDVI